MNESQNWITALGLIKHPEGGYYKETYRCPEIVNLTELPVPFSGPRHLSSSIYFLLPSNEVSRFHRLKSDEIWYFHAGSSLTIYLIDGKGNLSELKLGLNSALGELPQVIVPQGSIFGAVVNLENSFTLMGCMVSPGFDFNDFELMAQDPLLKKYPQHEKLIVKLT